VEDKSEISFLSHRTSYRRRNGEVKEHVCLRIQNEKKFGIIYVRNRKNVERKTGWRSVFQIIIMFDIGIIMFDIGQQLCFIKSISDKCTRGF